MAGPRLFVCNDTADYFLYPLNADGTDNLFLQYGGCLAGQGEWVDAESLTGTGTPETPITAGELTPEQFDELKGIAAEGFGSGFVVMATGLIIVQSIRWVVEFAKRG